MWPAVPDLTEIRINSKQCCILLTHSLNYIYIIEFYKSALNYALSESQSIVFK